MKFSGLVLAVFALVAILSIAESATTPKPKAGLRPTPKKGIKPKLPVKAALTTVKPNSCGVKAVCAPEPNVVWASDGTTCTPLASQCDLVNLNCARLAQKQLALKVVTQTQCQNLCSPICDVDFIPVCGQYNGKPTIFASECAMINTACLSGILYTLASPDLCALEVESYKIY